MKPKIQPGNSKLGTIPNISLPPGTTCQKDIPCYNDGCYARKFYNLWPACRNAWEHNLQAYNESPDGYFAEIERWLKKRSRSPAFFRFHVSGDIPTTAYLTRMMQLAGGSPAIRFMAFTKRTDLFTPLQLLNTPYNLKIILSRWPGDYVDPAYERLPQSWLTSDGRAPLDAFPCPGQCDRCAMCWKLERGESVIFQKH